MAGFADNSIRKFLTSLSERQPTPGGGSVAAVAGALASGLLCMVAEYSLGRSSNRRTEAQIKNVLEKAKVLRGEFMDLADEDAKAYKGVVRARGKSPQEQRKAARYAASIPKKVSQCCYRAIGLTPVLVKKGSPYLISDVEVAIEMFFSAYRSAMILVSANQ